MLNDAEKLDCVDAAEFILTEMERFAKLHESKASFSQTFRDGHPAVIELMSRVKHTETGREYTCGAEALRRFRRVAVIATSKRQDSSNFDVSEVADRLRHTFLSFAINDLDRQIDDFIEQWIEEAVDYIHRRHRPYVHYVPCVALQIGRETSYHFAGIAFIKKDVFRNQALTSFNKYEAARTRLSNRVKRNAQPNLHWCWEKDSSKPPQTPEQKFDELTAGVDWIAKVPVPRCSNFVSEIRAEAALRATLSSIILLLQGTEGAALRLGNDPHTPWKTNKLTSVGQGVFRPSSSWTFGAPKVEPGWIEHIADVAAPVLTVIEHIVQQTLEGRSLSFGFQIALRAITWYADAIRDSNIETRLIKCATAIECLILPVSNKVTPTFVIRGSLLAQRQEHPMSYWAPIAKRLYERRSDVAHGNIDSLQASQTEPVNTSLEFTRNVILQFLMFCRVLQPLGTRRVGTKEDFVELYRECEASYRDEITAIANEYGWNWFGEKKDKSKRTPIDGDKWSKGQRR